MAVPDACPICGTKQIYWQKVMSGPDSHSWLCEQGHSDIHVQKRRLEQQKLERVAFVDLYKDYLEVTNLLSRLDKIAEIGEKIVEAGALRKALKSELSSALDALDRVRPKD